MHYWNLRSFVSGLLVKHVQLGRDGARHDDATVNKVIPNARDFGKECINDFDAFSRQLERPGTATAPGRGVRANDVFLHQTLARPALFFACTGNYANK